MQQSIVKFYCFVVQTLLNMFRALQTDHGWEYFHLHTPEAATAVQRAPDDGHSNARNMLSSVCTTKH